MNIKNNTSNFLTFINLLIVVTYCQVSYAETSNEARLLRFPDISQNQIVFAYASDLWLVNKQGGEAIRLTSHEGEELHPKFSPDGKYIAFTASYSDGNQDVYTMSIRGGTPFRVTNHPSYDRLIDWTPDGKSLIFASSRESYRTRFNQLYKVSISGGLPEKLPMPYGEMATISPSGDAIIYSYLNDFQNQPDFNRETWKGYRGGRAPDLWYYNFDNKQSRKLTTNTAPDSAAMWTKKGIYFLSEREGKVSNLWHLDIDKNIKRRVTSYSDYDVTRPSFGEKDIVFEREGKLFTLSLDDEKVTHVAVTMVADSNSLRPVKLNVKERLSNAKLSNDGKELLIQARGDVFNISLEKNIIKNYGFGSKSAERFPSLSPDRNSLAYMSDSTGEYQLHVRNISSGKVKVMTSFKDGYRYRPHWSPDNKKIAFVDNNQKLYLFELKNKKLTHIDTSLWRYNHELEIFSPSWSKDSRWLAYDRNTENRNRAVFLYDTKKYKVHQITSASYDDFSPVFDTSGHYLYLLSSRTFKPIYSDIDFTWAYANSTSLAVITLQKDVMLPSENNDKAENKENKNSANFELENIEARLNLLKVTAGNYSNVEFDGDKLVYIRHSRSGSEKSTASAYFYDINKQTEHLIAENVQEKFDVAKGTILLFKNKDLHVVEIEENQKLEKPIDLSTLITTYDRYQENVQIFNDAWRFERDSYYDPNLHGADWSAIKDKYQGLVKHVRTDSDMSFLLREMAGEIAGGHVWATAVPRQRYRYNKTGLLGVDFDLHKGAYRFSKIYDAGAHRDDHRSPLRAPGINVSEGEYLLAVNGNPLDITIAPWAAFYGLANKTVELLVNDKPSKKGARSIYIKTLSNESKLRELAWVEDNRQKVELASNGQLGYIYVPDTSLNGQNELMRQYRSQFSKKGLVIDERFNSGGALGDRLVELLNRPPLVFFRYADGKDYPLPELSHYGPKALLINGWSYSGGDGFPLLFKAAKVGPLIGTRTWGGLIGPAMSMPLVSGGRIATPPLRVYSTEGKWSDPNGVIPDIEQENNPGQMMRGEDPQLERAIENVLSRLVQYPPHKVPAFESAVNLKE